MPHFPPVVAIACLERAWQHGEGKTGSMVNSKPLQQLGRRPAVSMATTGGNAESAVAKQPIPVLA